MNLYLVSQTERQGYDTFDAMVVAAESAREAALVHPREAWAMDDKEIKYNPWSDDYYEWASSPANVTVELLGTAVEGLKPGQIILASFNAG